jgi:hypothetical protein
MPTINRAVRDHQTDIDWTYREVCQRSWRVYDRFRQQFFPDLPDCYFRCETTTIQQKFAYGRGDNGIGAQFDFLLNARYLGWPRYKLYALIVHGLVHMQQEITDRGATRGYHSKALQEHSRLLGIPCQSGRSCEVLDWENPFWDLVMEVDPDAQQPMVAGVVLPERGESRLKKWSCGCTNVRAAVEVHAQCLLCGQVFVRQE